MVRSTDIGKSLKWLTVRFAGSESDSSDVFGHCQRVLGLADKIVASLPGANDADRMLVRQSAPVHDIGKLAVPSAILEKPGVLTPEEFGIVKRHSSIGASLLESVGAAENVVLVVRHHHERWDGDGYPDGLARESTPLAARVIAIADAFDAMCSNRPYRRALSRESALAELRRGAGTQFDPEIAELAFFLFGA